MIKKPNVGEHWMVKSTKSPRLGVMKKTNDGWRSIFDADGNKLDTFTRHDLTFEPICRFVRPEDIEIEYAIQQMTGFRQGKSDGCIESLAKGMGLSKEEWITIKEKQDGILDKFDNDVLDSCFGIS